MYRIYPEQSVLITTEFVGPRKRSIREVNLSARSIASRLPNEFYKRRKIALLCYKQKH